MNNLDSALVERLRELLAKATPGPWRVKTTGNIGCQIEAYRGRKDPTFMDDGMRSVASFQYCGPSDNYYEQQEVCAATGELIVAAVNALPALLDELDTLRTRLAGGGDDGRDAVGYVDGSRLHELREGRLNMALWAERSAYADTPLYTRPPSEAAAVDDAEVERVCALAANEQWPSAYDVDEQAQLRRIVGIAIASQQARAQG